MTFRTTHSLRLLICAAIVAIPLGARAAEPLRVAPFRADATPPLGAALCFGLVKPAAEIVDPLSARGIVLLPEGQKPIVLCAVDWVGIGNGAHRAWREGLAEAAGTSPDRVAVHCLHQHDAPGCDFVAEDLMATKGRSGAGFDPAHSKAVIVEVAKAIRTALAEPIPITHVGVGRAKVDRFASNRRVLGSDGKVKYTRYSASREPGAIAAPEGVIDPDVRLVGLWNGDAPVALLTYYATHPQSYYGQGGVSCDTVGLARGMREKALPEALHLHFCGAAGNVTAGKYNNGDPENREALAGRLAAGMEAALGDASGHRTAIGAEDVAWKARPVLLPASPATSDPDALAAKWAESPAFEMARDVAWARRVAAKDPIDITCLDLGPASLLHLPGELFIEYQLSAQTMRPDRFVAMAAYGDYGPGYIGTRDSYPQGGYEVSQVSNVAPEVEDVLVEAMRGLLDAPSDAGTLPSDFTARSPRLGAESSP